MGSDALTLMLTLMDDEVGDVGRMTLVMRCVFWKLMWATWIALNSNARRPCIGFW